MCIIQSNHTLHQHPPITIQIHKLSPSWGCASSIYITHYITIHQSHFRFINCVWLANELYPITLHYITIPQLHFRFINCARIEDEQNLVGFQYHEKIYYRVILDIQPGKLHFNATYLFGGLICKRMGPIELASVTDYLRNCSTKFLKFGM